MGWLDNLWRRRRGRATETPEDRAHVRAEERDIEPESPAAEVEERAHEERNEELLREPRVPPGTG